MKRILSALLVIAMLLSLVVLPTAAVTDPGAAELARQAAAEGIVLLKNEANALPLAAGETVSVFGRNQINTFYCGYGSGGGVRKPYAVSILEGLRNNPAIRVNEELAAIYTDWCKNNPPDDGSWGNWPTHYKEMALTDQQVAAARARSDKAIVVIGRSAGEDREASLTAGSYYLTDAEKEMLRKVDAQFDQVIVLLNVGNIIDMAWVSDYDLAAIAYVWQGGQETGNAIADVLSGDLSPSGKLSDTIAKTYADYPCASNFGGTSYNNYVEDIYVGYRYFETFAKDKVLYPFGFGLSYTSFAIEPSVRVDGDTLTVTARVTNTGSVYSGKEVVQVYYGAPQGQLGKPARSLVAYAKTNEIAPGASQTVTMSFDVDKMVSYDDSGKTGHKSAWVLEAGEYAIYVGNSVRSAVRAGAWQLDSLRVTEQLEEANAIASGKGFDRMRPQAKADGTYSIAWEAAPVETAEADLAARVLRNLPEAVPMTGDQGWQLIDVYNGAVTMDEFIAQLSPRDLADLSRGDFTKSSSLGPSGNASVFAGVTESLRSFGIPAISTVDGPSGIAMGATATLCPIGTAQACTWNNELIRRLYEKIGNELCLNKVDALLGPGMNIHRSPLCGRNFEYFSEDPLLTGMMGAMITRGLQRSGSTATPKHYALNNQEVARHTSDSRASERAQREIYLRGFEICVKSANPYNIMGSYNLINGEWSHYNYDTCTTILRNDWDWDGCMETDWWLRQDTSAQLGNVTNNAYRVRAQMDVNMPGQGPGVNDGSDEIVAAYETWLAAGSPTDRLVGLTLGEMQRTAKNVLRYAMRSWKFRDTYDLPNTYLTPADWFSAGGTAWKEKPTLDSLTIDGMERFNAFDPAIKTYQVFRQDLSTLPAVRATAPKGEVFITQATAQSPCATITVLAEGEKVIYRVFFTDKAGLSPVVSDPVLAKVTAIAVDGRYIDTFYPTTQEYRVRGDAATSEISVETAPGVTASFTRDAERREVRIRAVSADQASEYVLKFPAPAAAPTLVSDDFSSGTLDPAVWQVYNPGSSAKLGVQDGQLFIDTDAGEWYGGAASTKNVVYQPNAEGDWTAYVDLTIPDPSKLANINCNQFALTVFDDGDNFIDLMYVTYPATWCPNGQIFQIRREIGGKNEDGLGRKPIPGDEGWGSEPQTVTYRLQKVGNQYTFAIQTQKMREEGSGFAVYPTITMEFDAPKLGLYATAGNAGAASSRVTFDNFRVEFPQGPQSDDFDDGTLAPFWSVLNKTDKLSESGGCLTIATEGGEWYGAAANTKNVVYQDGSGNWTATAELRVPTPAALKGIDTYQFGLAVFDSPDQFVDLLYTTASWASGGQFLQVRREEGATCDDKISNGSAHVAYKSLPTTEGWTDRDEVTIWLRVRKEGNTFRFFVLSEDMKAAGRDFAEIGVTDLILTDPKVGLYASHGNGSGASVPVQFGSIVFTDYEAVDPPLPDPIVPVAISASEPSFVMGFNDMIAGSDALISETCTDPTAPGVHVAYGNNGHWAQYAIQVAESGWYDVATRYASNASDALAQLNHDIELDGDLVATYSPGITGGWNTWQTTPGQRVYLTAGRHSLMFRFGAQFNLNYILFTPTDAHDLTLTRPENGTLRADRVRGIDPGQSVKLTATPDDGLDLLALRVWRTDDPSVTVPVAEDGTFPMPAFDVTAAAEFGILVPDPSDPVRGSKVARVFIDVTEPGYKANQLYKGMDYVSATIRVEDPTGTYATLDETIGIKIRGNSTAGLPKKPFNIKFSSKIDLLGMGAGKKWCLLANMLDKSLMRNRLTYDFADRIGMDYVPACRPIDVWLDGVFAGSYLVTEPVEAKQNRVEIDPENTTDFLFELEASRNETGKTYIRTSRYGLRFVMEDPEEPTAEQLASATAQLKAVEDAIATGDLAQMEQIIDIDSFVDLYIVEELFKNVDCDFSSVKFYFKDGILYAGPVWDYDLSAGNVNPNYDSDYAAYNNVGGSGKSSEGYYARKTIWYPQLFQNEVFAARVRERYVALQPMIVNLYERNDLGKSQIDRLLAECGISFRANWSPCTPWTFSRNSSYERDPDPTFEENVAYLRGWLAERNAWLLQKLDSAVIVAADAPTRILAYEDAISLSSKLRPETCTDPTAAGQNIAYAASGESALYRLKVAQAGWYDLTTRYAANGSSANPEQVYLGQDLVASYPAPTTGGWQSWVTTAPQRIWLDAGVQELRYVFGGSVNLNYLTLTPVESYRLTLPVTAHGSVTASAAVVPVGDRVSLSIQPDAGYVLRTLKVYRTGEPAAAIAVEDDGSFAMPAFDVTVEASFYQPDAQLEARARAAAEAAERANAAAEAARAEADSACAAAEAAEAAIALDLSSAAEARRAAEAAQARADAAETASAQARAAAEAARLAAIEGQSEAAEAAASAAAAAATASAEAAKAAEAAASAAQAHASAQSAQASAEAAATAADSARAEAESARAEAASASATAAADRTSAEAALSAAATAQARAEAAEAAAEAAEAAASAARTAARSADAEAAASAASAAAEAAKTADSAAAASAQAASAASAQASAQSAQNAAEAAQAEAEAARSRAEAAKASAEAAGASAAADRTGAEAALSAAVTAQTQAEAAQNAAEAAQRAAAAARASASVAQAEAAQRAAEAAAEAAAAAAGARASAEAASAAAEAQASAQSAQASAETAQAEAEAARTRAQSAQAAAEAAGASAAADRTSAEAAQKAAATAQTQAEAAQSAAAAARKAAEASASAAASADTAASAEAAAAAAAAQSAASAAAGASADAARAAIAQASAQSAQSAAEAAKAEAEAARQAAIAAQARADEAAATTAADQSASEAAAAEARTAAAAAAAAEAAAANAASAAETARQNAASANGEAAAAAAASAQGAQQAAKAQADIAATALELAKLRAEAQAAVAATEAAQAEAEAAAAAAARYEALLAIAARANALRASGLTEAQSAALEAAAAAARAQVQSATTAEAVQLAQSEGLSAMEAACARCPSADFADVATDAWYHESIDFMVANGYMNGMSPTIFGLTSPVTRAQLVTILYRIEGAPAVEAENPFADVPADRWYTDAVIWAAANGIVNGVAEGRFAPEASLTREQIAAILYRHARAEAPADDSLTDFADSDRVSDWAVDAMRWAVAQGLINGIQSADGASLAPAAPATRVQIAAILTRYLTAN